MIFGLNIAIMRSGYRIQGSVNRHNSSQNAQTIRYGRAKEGPVVVIAAPAVADNEYAASMLLTLKV